VVNVVQEECGTPPYDGLLFDTCHVTLGVRKQAVGGGDTHSKLDPTNRIKAGARDSRHQIQDSSNCSRRHAVSLLTIHGTSKRATQNRSEHPQIPEAHREHGS
jgi:hypothetical protein